MIDTDRCFGTTIIYCDRNGCKQDILHEGFDGYYDVGTACKEAKEEGWIIIKKDGEWYHYCSLKCKKMND